MELKYVNFPGAEAKSEWPWEHELLDIGKNFGETIGPPSEFWLDLSILLPSLQE